MTAHQIETEGEKDSRLEGEIEEIEMSRPVQMHSLKTV